MVWFFIFYNDINGYKFNVIQRLSPDAIIAIKDKWKKK